MKSKLLNYGIPAHEQHPFHLVDPSPWPIMTSMALWSSALGFMMYFHLFNYGWLHLLIGMLSVCFCLTGWFLDVMSEATFQGYHTFKVQQNMYLGMLLFMVSEMMFFFSFFWAFFHFSLSPSIWIGGIWPPKGMLTINPWSFPLFNTIVLLTSGVHMTMGHMALKLGQFNSTRISIWLTVVHGMVFSYVQLWEYRSAPFSMNDSVYGSMFYMTTGFHGMHVLVGTLFLVVCGMSHEYQHFFSNHHVGFVCAMWYWHFVDVVWMFLYLCVYIWGS